MKFLIFGDLNGKTEIVQRLLKLNLNQYDFLVYTGDTPDPSIFKALRESKVSKGINQNTDIEQELIKNTIPHQALKKSTQEVMDICKLLEKTSVPIYGVLGNADLEYYSQFVDWPFILLHNQITKIGDYNLIGYNGRPLYQFEVENKNEQAFAESAIEQDLKKLFVQIDARKTILVTHVPPYQILDQVDQKMKKYAVGTYGKRAETGHIGSIGLKKIVDQCQPLLHIFGHIHEAEGVLEGKTTFVNLGSTGETKKYCEITLNLNEINYKYIKLN